MRNLFRVNTILLFASLAGVQAQAQTSAIGIRIAEAIRSERVIRVRSGMGVIAVQDPRIENDSLVGFVQTGEIVGEPTLAPYSTHLNSVSEIIVRRGTHALEGLGLGVLSGFVLVAAIHQACQQDSAVQGGSCETAIPVGEIYAIGVGSFGLLGLLFGAASPRWKTVYRQGTPLVPDPYVGFDPQSGRVTLGFRVFR